MSLRVQIQHAADASKEKASAFSRLATQRRASTIDLTITSTAGEG